MHLLSVHQQLQPTRLRAFLVGVFLTGLLCMFAAPARLMATEDPAAIVDTWTLPDGEMKIEIYACQENKFCGRIAWMKDPNTSAGQPRMDDRNPNPKKRSTSLMGMEILWGLTHQDGKWVNGQIYNIGEGKTYNCSIQQIEPAKIQVHSFVGIAALGKTHIWTR